MVGDTYTCEICGLKETTELKGDEIRIVGMMNYKGRIIHISCHSKVILGEKEYEETKIQTIIDIAKTK